MSGNKIGKGSFYLWVWCPCSTRIAPVDILLSELWTTETWCQTGSLVCVENCPQGTKAYRFLKCPCYKVSEKCKSKHVKRSRYAPYKRIWVTGGIAPTLSLTSALEGGEWSASRPGRALPSDKEPPVPTVQEAGWAPEPVWTQTV
jgi:hypothetical protein